MHQILVDFGTCQLIGGQYFVNQTGNGFTVKLIKLGYPLQPAFPAFPVSWLDGLISSALPAIGNQQHVTATTITSKLESAQ